MEKRHRWKVTGVLFGELAEVKLLRESTIFAETIGEAIEAYRVNPLNSGLCIVVISRILHCPLCRDELAADARPVCLSCRARAADVAWYDPPPPAPQGREGGGQ